MAHPIIVAQWIPSASISDPTEAVDIRCTSPVTGAAGRKLIRTVENGLKLRFQVASDRELGQEAPSISILQYARIVNRRLERPHRA
jgi:hypothetical protein